MATTTALLFVGKFALSFIFAIIMFYIMDEEDAKVKRKKIDDLLSLLLQFIIYIWLAKMIWDLPMLFRHPFSVLAYPSNSTHFYTATVLTSLHFYWQHRHDKSAIQARLNMFIRVALLALFMYEFLEIILNPYTQLDLYFVLLTVIVALMTLYQKKAWATPLMFNIWLLMVFILSLSKGYYQVFNYFIHPIYFIVMLIGLSSLYLILNKSRGKNA